MSNQSNTWKIINWILGLILLVIGILNIWLVDVGPGMLYIVFSFLYYPPLEVLTKEKLGFAFPNWLKAIIWLVIMWATLAVGDLAEIAGL